MILAYKLILLCCHFRVVYLKERERENSIISDRAISAFEESTRVRFGNCGVARSMFYSCSFCWFFIFKQWIRFFFDHFNVDYDQKCDHGHIFCVLLLLLFFFPFDCRSPHTVWLDSTFLQRKCAIISSDKWSNFTIIPETRI